MNNPPNSTTPEAFSQSELLYRSLFEVMDQGFCLVELLNDPDGKAVDYRFVEVNAVFERQTGYVGAKGKRATELAPNLTQAWIDTVDQVARTGQPLRTEAFFDDPARWYAISMSRLGEAPSRLVASVFDDITEQKRIQESLQLNHLWLTLAMQSAKAGWGNWNLLSGEAEWSPEGRAIIGFSSEEEARTAEGWLGRIHPDDRPKVDAEAARVMATQTDFNAEYRVMHDDGQIRWVLGTGRMSFDANGVAYRSTGLVLDITDRKRTEATLRQSEERYRAIFNSMAEGYSLLDIQFDDQGVAYDVIIRDVNPAQQRIDGLPALVGRRVREMLPDIEPKWIERYAQIARSGESAHFEDYSAATQRWYDVNAARVGGADSTLVAIIYNDITERKRQQQRQTFLLGLSDALSALSDPEAIEEVATRLMMDYVGADRCCYCEIEGDQVIIRRGASRPGFPAVSGTYPLGSLPIDQVVMDAERPFIVEDARHSDRLDASLRALCLQWQIGSFMNVPLRKGKKVVGILCTTQATTRNWTDFDVDLAGEVTERIWAAVERARTEEALRQSEAKYRSLFDSIDEGFCLIKLLYDAQGKPLDWIYLLANPTFERQIGTEPTGKKVSQVVGQVEAFWFEFYHQVIQTQRPARTENYLASLDRWYSIYAMPVEGTADQLAVVFDDITERKRREARVVLLGEINESIAQLTAPEAIMQVVGEKLFAYYELSRLTFVYVHTETGLVSVVYDRHAPSLASVLGDQRMADFVNPDYVQEFQSGQLIAINDVMNDPRTANRRDAYRVFSQGAILLAPLVNDGRWRFAIALHKEEPFTWRVDQLELLNELTPRLYVALERQRLEQLRQLTLLQQTEELAKIGSYEYNRPTGQLSWSAGMYQLFGMTPGQPVEPQIYLDAVLNEDQRQAQALLTYWRQGEGHFEADLRIRVGERIKTLRIKAAVIGEGDQGRVLGVDLDISDELAAQRRIQETAQNLQVVLDGSPAAIGLLKTVRDPANPERILDFRLAVGNRKLGEFFNEPLEKLLGQSAGQFSELLWGEATLAILRQVSLTGQARYDEKRLSAEGRWLALAVTPQEDGVLVTALDISELKSIQHQQQQWLSEVEASRQSVDALTELKTTLANRTDMLRAVSHDLRGNLGVITGSLQLLGMAETESDRAEMMAMVLRNVQQATGLLTDLLDLVRLESGQQQRTIISFDASELMVQLGQSLQPVAQQKELMLRISGPATLLIENDRQLVYRLAQNLLINALKYTRQGGVTLGWSAAGDRWQFEIMDTGPGLHPDLVQGLHSLDAQPLSVSTPAQGGTSWIQLPGEGIGLRIVRELIRLLNARLEVSSEAGVGTRFLISFPRRYPPPSASSS